MNTKIPIIISVAVAVMMVGALLVPFIDSATDEYSEMYNNSSANLSSILSENMNIEFTADALTVNGEDVPISSPTGLRIVTDSFNIIRTEDHIELAYKGNPDLVIFTELSISMVDEMATIDWVDSSSVEGSVVLPVEWGFVLDPDGDYGLLRYYNLDRNIYLKSIDDLYGSNRLITTGDWFSFHGDNVILSDGTKIKANYSLNPISGYEGVSTINIGGNGTGFSFTVDNDGEPYTVSPWIYVAPNEVVAYKTGLGSLALLFAIPPILIVAFIAILAKDRS